MQPRDAPAPLRGDQQLVPSSQQVIDALLQRLQCNREMLDTWTERLREWFAHWVIGELLRLLAKSHKVGGCAPASLQNRLLIADAFGLRSCTVCSDLGSWWNPHAER